MDDAVYNSNNSLATFAIGENDIDLLQKVSIIQVKAYSCEI